MWKKSGAWFYNEIPEYIKPVEEPESHSPLLNHPKISWQHYTKPATSNLTYLSNNSQQSRNERYRSAEIFPVFWHYFYIYNS